MPKGTITMFIIEHAISGYRRSISEVFTVPGYCEESTGSYVRFGFLEDGNYRLSRNVGNNNNAAQYPRKTKTTFNFIPKSGNAPRRIFQSDLNFFSIFTKTKSAVPVDMNSVHLNLEDSWLEASLEHRLPWLKIFMVFLSSSKQMLGQYGAPPTNSSFYVVSN
jgi:hypothetical protein